MTRRWTPSTSASRCSRHYATGRASRSSRFLLYYRLVGVALFELTGWRPLLVIFPNTFEYFFILDELYVVRWSAARLTGRRLLVLAAGIWLLVKLPQEYWIHILKRDVTGPGRGRGGGVAARPPPRPRA